MEYDTAVKRNLLLHATRWMNLSDSKKKKKKDTKDYIKYDPIDIIFKTMLNDSMEIKVRIAFTFEECRMVGRRRKASEVLVLFRTLISIVE